MRFLLTMMGWMTVLAGMLGCSGPNLSKLGRVAVGDRGTIELPTPFEPSFEIDPLERALAAQGTTAPVPVEEWRWYLNYRSTLSGYPEYDAVFIAASTAQYPDLEDFITKALTAQRNPGWSGADWQTVSAVHGTTLQSMIPYNPPLAQVERNRLVRVYLTTPSNGLWLGLVALQRVVPSDRALEMVEHASASFQSTQRTGQLNPSSTLLP